MITSFFANFNMNDKLKKFQSLIKEIFQFEASDLDFGIYRILNYKRDRIEKFIQEDLKNKAETAFAKHKDERLTNIEQRFEEAKQKIIQNFGQNAFTPTGELKEKFKDTPLGKEFLSIKAQKDEAQAIDEIKSQVSTTFITSSPATTKKAILSPNTGIP